MECIGSLYHWSPTSRRTKILEYGLVPGSIAVVAPENTLCIFASPSPKVAWNISGHVRFDEEFSSWDLWQITLDVDDRLAITGHVGPFIAEIEIYYLIPPDRLWLVGTRNDRYLAPNQVRD